MTHRSFAFALAAVSLAGCSGAATPVAAPGPAPAPIAEAPPDAGVSDAVTSAPAWVFRYHTADRDETWTLRYAGAEAMIEVQSAAGVTRYVGTATDGDTLVLDLSAPTAKIALDCKRVTRAFGAACNDTTAAPIDVLDCYHRDFDAPMPFAAAPGVEYVVDDTCNGYRLAP